MSNGAPFSEELLGIYHDLWDLRIRARGMNRGFLDYLLEVALEDVKQDLSGHSVAHQQHGPPRQGSGR